MIDDEVSKKRRAKWLTSENFMSRYIEIRTVVEGLFNDSKHSEQLKWFTIHGREHSLALENNLYCLIPTPYESKSDNSEFCSNNYEFKGREVLTESERFFLIISAWLHDLGMIKFSDKDKELSDEQIRDNHHSRSEKYIVNNFSKLQISEGEASLLGIMAYYHRRRCSIEECPDKLTIAGHDGAVRVRLLAAYLRLADAMHVDFTRAPAKDYAILLTYNIPTSNKLHWLKSNFVLGISADIAAKTITITFKAPTDEVMKTCIQDLNGNVFGKEDRDDWFKERDNSHKKENIFKNTLDAIYDEIYQDLQGELDSVKEVLIRGNISCFLNVKKETCQVEIKDQFLNDIKTILHHYPSLNNPSGSSLHQIIVDTLIQICKVTRNESEETKKDRITSFLNDIEENILKPRKSYVGLNNLCKELKEISEEIPEKRKEKLKGFIKTDIEKKYSDELGNGQSEEHIDELVKKDVDERIKKIEGKYQTFENKALTELEIFLYHKRGKLEEDANSVRKNASSFFSKIISDNKKDDELESIKKRREIFNKIYQAFISNLRNNGEKTTQSNENKGNAKNDSNTDAEKQKEKFEREFNRERVNILLFGYSKLVIKALCGFRDAVIKSMIDDLSKKTPEQFAWHRIDLEKTASNFFRIFVCEGQPKNRLGWSNKVVYHDGINYAKQLHEYGFTNIFLIPDATAASLLDNAEINNHGVNVHFVILGVNSYKENEKFIHSVGHAMVAKLTQVLKDKITEAQKAKEKVEPMLIFSVTTDKQGTFKLKKKPSKVEYVEGWAFASFKGDEEIKKRFFFALNPSDRDTIKGFGNDFMIYNPKLDVIPYKYADLVIDENGYRPPDSNTKNVEEGTISNPNDKTNNGGEGTTPPKPKANSEK